MIVRNPKIKRVLTLLVSAFVNVALRSVVLLAVHLHVVVLTLVAVLSFVIRMGSLFLTRFVLAL